MHDIMAFTMSSTFFNIPPFIGISGNISFMMMILSSCWRDLTYMGKEMFIMRRIWETRNTPNGNMKLV
jgi:hypothetical protein